MRLPRSPILRYLVLGVLGLLLLVVLAVGVVLVGGEWRFSRSYEAPAHAFPAIDDSVGIAEGERLARFWGCTGCHNRDAGGQVMFESPVGDRVVAPNLTRIVHSYEPDELELAIRHGIGRDGSSVVVMPSSMFARMSDGDLGKVVAYLRSLPPVPDTLPSTRLGLFARWLALRSDRVVEAAGIPADTVHGPGPDSLDASSTRADTLALGRYLALTGCPECHGPDLGGHEDGAPDLRIAAAYSPEKFMRLAREGLDLSGQERGLMTVIARGRIDRLSDDEVRALHAYLKTLADRDAG